MPLRSRSEVSQDLKQKCPVIPLIMREWEKEYAEFLPLYQELGIKPGVFPLRTLLYRERPVKDAMASILQKMKCYKEQGGDTNSLGFMWRLLKNRHAQDLTAVLESET